MKRATINKDTFERIFESNEDLLAKMVSSLSRINYDDLTNNVTSNLENPCLKDYVVRMPDDYIIEVLNIKTKEIITIVLKK